MASVSGLFSAWWSGKAFVNDWSSQPCKGLETVSSRRRRKLQRSWILLGVFVVMKLWFYTKNFLHAGYFSSFLTLQIKKMISIFVLPSKVRSKFGRIKNFFPGVRNTTMKPFGHFCSRDFVSRHIYFSPCFSACSETQVKEGKHIPSDVFYAAKQIHTDTQSSTMRRRILRDKYGKADLLSSLRSSTGLRQPPASFYSPLLRGMELHQGATLETLLAGLVCERYAQHTLGRLFQLFAISGPCDWWTSINPQNTCVFGCPWRKFHHSEKILDFIR